MNSLYSPGLSVTSRSLGLRWAAPAATVVLWTLAAASAVFWVLRLAAPADALAPPVASTRLVAAPDPVAVGRLLGAVPKVDTVTAAPEAASRFALWGVVAYGTSRGAALISMDGKPPRPWRVGAQLSEGYVLQSVGRRSATLGTNLESAPAFTLQMPVRAPISLNRPLTGSPSGSAVSSGLSLPGTTFLPPVMAPPPGVVGLPAPMYTPQGGLMPVAPVAPSQ